MKEYRIEYRYKTAGTPFFNSDFMLVKAKDVGSAVADFKAEFIEVVEFQITNIVKCGTDDGIEIDINKYNQVQFGEK